ncbi:MAG: hypothetical protein QXR87_07880, partial [Candidatus Hadarchaeales archaeon]
KGRIEATLDNSDNVLSLRSIVEPDSGVSTYPLYFSASHSGHFHYYDKQDRQIKSNQSLTSRFLTGIRDKNFEFPKDIGQSKSYEATNLVGLFSQTEGTWWGSFSQSGSVKGYSAGYLKDSSNFNFMIYGLYRDPSGGMGIISGTKFGSNNYYLGRLGVLDAEPQYVFKKYGTGLDSLQTISTSIKGTYQGYFLPSGQIEKNVIESTSFGTIGSKTLSIIKNAKREPWGVFGIEIGGSHPGRGNAGSDPGSLSGLVLELGGSWWDQGDENSENKTPHYWMGHIQGGEISGSYMNGSFSGKFMSPTHYGTISGRMIGELKSDNTWVGVVLGTYGEDVVELGHNSHVTQGKVYEGSFNPVGTSRSDFSTSAPPSTNDSAIAERASISSYLGGTGLNANEPLYSVGMIYDPNNQLNLSQGAGYVWMSGLIPEKSDPSKGDPSRYRLYAAGRLASDSQNNYNLNGYVAGIIGNDSSGYSGLFVGDLLTDNSPNLLSLEKRFFMEGTIRGVVDLGSASSVSEGQISYINVLSSGPSNESGFSVTQGHGSGSFFMDTGKYGIGSIGMGGTYSGNPSDWYVIYEGSLTYGDFKYGDFGAISYGSIWGNDGNIQSVIKGRTFGYYSDLSKDTPVTGIFVGETVGTFNPSATSDKTWQTVTVGTTLETSTFLGKVASSGSELSSISVPVVEIGRVNLSGVNLNSNCENCIKDVQLTDVRFFAPSTGSPPTVFATDRVTGSYSGNPLSSQQPSDRQITIGTGSTGNNMISNLIFEVSSWSNDNSNKWSARIYPGNGAIGSIGTDPSYTIHDMRGIAAGTYNGGKFSGTAAGIVRASMPRGTVGSSQ